VTEKKNPIQDDNPVGDNPIGQNPIGQNPTEHNPVGQNPIGQNPVAQNPIGQNPVAQNPVAQNPVGQNPAQNPVGKNPVAQISCPVCGSTFSSLTKFCPNDGQALFTTQAISMQLIPSYEFTGEIGSGGMGVVYKAMHVVLKKPVAIKVLPIHQLDQNGIRRFQQEARAASLLRHDNLVTVSDCGVTVTGQPYMVMDFVDGKTLEKLLKEKGSLSEEDALPIFEQICQAVEHAHGKGVLHRDLKPSNVMLVDTETGKPIVKVLDFGLAKIVHGELKLTQGLTSTGEVFGSPLYMSPEQALGQDVDARSDIYSLACLMYETLTGAPPLLGSSMMETFYKQIHEEAPSLSEGSLGKKFSADWEAFIAKGLSKEPDKRFASVTEMRQALPFPGRRTERVSAEVISGAGRNTSKRQLIVIVSCAIPAVIGVSMLLLDFSLVKQPKTPEQDKVKTETPGPVKQKSPSQELFWGGYSADDLADQTIKNSNDTKLDLGRKRERPLTDEGIKALRAKSKIEELKFVNDKITSDGVDSFAHLPLQLLDLTATSVDDAGLKKVSVKIPTLKTLVLNQMKITDAGIGYISHLPQLDRLCANRIETLSDKALGYLGKTRTLTSLELEGDTRLTAAGIAQLQDLKHLRYLDLKETNLGSGCGSTLKKFTKLTGLNLSGTAVGDQTIANLAQLKLCELNLAQSKISSRSTEILGGMKTLTRLDLSNTESLGDQDLKNLAGLANLDTLDLSGCRLITDSGMQYLSSMKSLRTLNLSGTRVTDFSLAQLANLPQLHDLNVSNTVIDDQGVYNLLAMPLQRLDLSYTRITGAGFVKLGRMKLLRDLNVTKCELHARDEEGFRQEQKKVKHENEFCALEPRELPP
jgi:serine/threonine protein kinase